MNDAALANLVRHYCYPLIQARSDLDAVIEQIGNRSIVLLGESTHGTHEFYETRARLTQRLIEEKKFTAVAIEADWPDAIKLNRFVRGHETTNKAMEALHTFQKFPMWMWRNSSFLSFIEWLFVHNRKETTHQQTGIYGIDLYSLYPSLREVIRYLDENDPEAARRARDLYSCFDHYGQDPLRYGRFVRVGAQPSCETAAVEAVLSLFKNDHAREEAFYARQNAELVRDAESYYRNLFNPLVNTWNVRDRHMADTIDELLDHLTDAGRPAKVIVWAHNSHVGDDRATEMGARGRWNLGQLLRQRHPGDTFSLGFSLYEGTVTAATEWDRPPQLRTVLPAPDESYEAIFHRTGLAAFYLSLENPEVASALREPRLERAIGVIYSPETERLSHYFQASLSEQFDGILHFDRAREVEPLDRLAPPEVAEPSEIQF